MYIGLILSAINGCGDSADCLPTSLMLLRLLRLLRIFKVVRHYEGSAILTEALRRSIKPLMIPLFFVVLMTFAFAGTIYYTKGVVGGNPNFDNIFKAAWFVLVTLTTVGYGDVTPTSWPGQMTAAVCIVCGVLFMAMPITIVGNEFTIVWHERELLQVVKGVRRGMRERGMQPFEAATVFREFDTSSDGTLDLGEFNKALEAMGVHLSRTRLRQVFKIFDSDGDGVIDCTPPATPTKSSIIDERTLWYY